MRPEVRLALYFSAICAVTTITGCVDADEPRNKVPSERLPAASTATASIKSDLLKPLPFSRQQILIYPQGAVVNLTAGVDLGVIKENLTKINSDPRFGINFGENDQNITYFYPDSFRNRTNLLEAVRTTEEQFPMIMAALSAEQQITGGRVRFNLISVADALHEVQRMAPRRLSENDPFWSNGLNVELGNAYVSLNRERIFDISQTPQVYPLLPQEFRTSLAQELAYPFVFTVNPAYLRALDLLPTYFN